jgi:ribosomal protein S3
MKTVLNFSGGRSEIIGIKLQFKGRFDRWRRTKSLIAKGGSIPAQTFNALIEYGSSKGFVKKGAFGIRIWIRYEKIFGLLYKQTFEQYFMYSCLNKINKI